MKQLLALASVAVVALAAGCGGGDDASDAAVPVTVTVTETTTLPVPPTVLTSPPVTAPPATGTTEESPSEGDGDEAAIREVHDAYAKAFLDLDGTEACSRLSPAGEAQAVMQGRQNGFGADCPSALRAGALAIKSFDGDDVAVTLSDLEVSGDSARATAVYRGSRGSTRRAPTFERLGGEWYVGPDRG